MPPCRDCRWLTTRGTCGIVYDRPATPLRGCVEAIAREYAELIGPSHHVLEVGCGSWSPIKERAREVGAHWEGIDLADTRLGRRTLATQIASVAAIPFGAGSFDFVVSSQSMEHWEEHRVDLRKGLSEVFRVLKPGGWALVNVPMVYHGGHRFVTDDTAAIRTLFAPFADELRMEAWRQPPDPLPPVRYHLRYYWFRPSLRSRSGYVLDIRARRGRKAPYFDCARISTPRKLYEGLRYRGVLYYATLAAGRLGGRGEDRDR